MKQTLSLVALVAMICLMSACGKKAATPEPTIYTVEALLAGGENLAGQTVTIEGVCSHLCKHGGRKMFVKDGEDGQLLRVEAGELGSFPQEAIGQKVRVTGELAEQRIDEDYLRGWEQQAAQTEEERQAQAVAENANGDAQAESAEGEAQESHAGHCDTDKQARQEVGNTVEERIAGYRDRIAQQVAAGGKSYLSFFHIVAQDYEIVE